VGETSSGTPGDRALEITRTFDAPRRAVFDPFTLCDSASQWMGPPAWEVTGCEIDPRPGGVYRFVWKSPQGYEVENRGTCDEVSAPERLVTTQAAGAGVTRHTIVLTETGSATTMTYTVEYPTSEMRDAAAQLPMKEAMDAGYDKLAEFLRTIA
jgi:uncharacterized protein YndB with AHSA1/START domain